MKSPENKRPLPKVVGSASEKEKDAFSKKVAGFFGENHLKDFKPEIIDEIKSLEFAKEDFEVRTIEVSNLIINSLLKEFNLDTFDIPARNVHILPNDLFRKIRGSSSTNSGFTDYRGQFIGINKNFTTSKIILSNVIFHEMLHLCSCTAFALTDDGYSSSYRTGLGVSSVGRKRKELGHIKYFEGLLEAVNTEIETKYTPELIRLNSYLEGENNWQNSEEITELKKQIATKNQIPVENILWLNPENKEINLAGYPEPREVLNYIVDSIYEDNKEKFNSKEEAMKLFFKAHFNGNLLEIGRLVEKSFGEGSFRILGMMNTDTNSVRQTKDYFFRKKRKK